MRRNRRVSGERFDGEALEGIEAFGLAILEGGDRVGRRELGDELPRRISGHGEGRWPWVSTRSTGDGANRGYAGSGAIDASTCSKSLSVSFASCSSSTAVTKPS